MGIEFHVQGPDTHLVARQGPKKSVGGGAPGPTIGIAFDGHDIVFLNQINAADLAAVLTAFAASGVVS
jgi:hypothetical protein